MARLFKTVDLRFGDTGNYFLAEECRIVEVFSPKFTEDWGFERLEFN